MTIEGVISLYSESVKLAERSAGLCERDDDHEKANDWREDAKFCKQMIAWLKELQERRKEQYLTIEQIAAVVGSQTIHSARLWIDFAYTLDVLGYGVVKRRTDGSV